MLWFLLYSVHMPTHTTSTHYLTLSHTFSPLFSLMAIQTHTTLLHLTLKHPVSPIGSHTHTHTLTSTLTQPLPIHPWQARLRFCALNTVGPYAWVLQDSPFEGCYQKAGCCAFLEMGFFQDEEPSASALQGPMGGCVVQGFPSCREQPLPIKLLVLILPPKVHNDPMTVSMPRS